LGKGSVDPRHLHKKRAGGNAQIAFPVLFSGTGIIDFGFVEKPL
jgi:hypothetical protein